MPMLQNCRKHCYCHLAITVCVVPFKPWCFGMYRGWKLLTQMGYKDGEGLGVNKQGRKDPVGLSLKRGRSGLGAVAPHQEKTSKKKAKGQSPQSTNSSE